MSVEMLAGLDWSASEVHRLVEVTGHPSHTTPEVSNRRKLLSHIFLSSLPQHPAWLRNMDFGLRDNKEIIISLMLTGFSWNFSLHCFLEKFKITVVSLLSGDLVFPLVPWWRIIAVYRYPMTLVLICLLGCFCQAESPYLTQAGLELKRPPVLVS